MLSIRRWLILYGHHQNLINLLKRSDLHKGQTQYQNYSSLCPFTIKYQDIFHRLLYIEYGKRIKSGLGCRFSYQFRFLPNRLRKSSFFDIRIFIFFWDIIILDSLLLQFSWKQISFEHLFSSNRIFLKYDFV